MKETRLKVEEAKLRETVDRLKLEMKGITEDEWVQAIEKSRRDRLHSTIRTSEV
jgi:hypothetical protein